MKDNKNIIITLLIASVFALGGYFVGAKTQKVRIQGVTRQQGMVAGARQNGQWQRGGIRPVAGEILSRDEKTMIVKLTDGSSKIIILSEKTVINKASDATRDELKSGEKISVFGTENPDGSVTANNIQIGVMTRVLIKE